MNPAISVIVPMFNAQDYIGECLTSLAQQTFTDFEVVVADDCSTDSSVAVVENFSQTFGGRLTLTQTAINSGSPGVARNLALTVARGKYVCFLDSDDMLTETALAELHAAAENFSADVVHAERCIVFKRINGEIIGKPATFQTGAFVTEPTLETFDIGERIVGFTRKRFAWWACTKLFRRKFLVDNRIVFPAANVFEDFAFVFMCIAAARNYVRVPYVSYLYRIRGDSISQKVRDPIDSTKTAIKVAGALAKFMGGRKFFRDNPQYEYALLDFFLQERLGIIAKKLFIDGNFSPADVFSTLRDEIFSADPPGNVALTAYLFVAANIFKLYTNQQAAEIDALKRQSPAPKNLEVTN